MKKYRIPRKNADVRGYAIWKNLKYLVFYIAFVAVMSLAFWSYLGRRPEGIEPLKWWVYPLFELTVVVVGWFVCCMSRFTFDRYVCGRISSLRMVRSYGRALSRQARLTVGFYNYVKVDVACENGRKSVNIQIFEDGYDGYYREGGTLVKFRGLNYPLCLEAEAEGAHICAVCGVRSYDKNARRVDGMIACSSCGRSLIDVKDLER